MMIQTHDGKSIAIAPSIAVGADIDYGFDWTDWLKEGDVITQSTWVTSNDSLTLGTTVISAAVTYVMVSTPVLGTKYKLSNTIVTYDGLTDTRSMWIKCTPK